METVPCVTLPTQPVSETVRIINTSEGHVIVAEPDFDLEEWDRVILEAGLGDALLEPMHTIHTPAGGCIWFCTRQAP